MKKIFGLFYKNYQHLHFVPLLKIFLYQKVFGFNRHVCWPVHWSTTVVAPAKINPGSRSPGLSRYCHLDGRNGIEFGDNCWVGPGVRIISMNHDLNNYKNYIKDAPIIIGDDCWIGAGATILPGVTLGAHSVVAAGALVTKSFPNNNQVIGGVPAKLIKSLPPYAG